MAQAIAGFDAGKCASADGQSSRLEEYLGRHGLRPARIMYTAVELARLHFVTQIERGLEDAGRGRENLRLCCIAFNKAAARRAPMLSRSYGRDDGGKYV